MAWTSPRTWVDGELVDDTLMNVHLRDNLNAIRTLCVRKTADEALASNTTLQNDDHLLFAIAANEVWIAKAVLFVSGAPAGDIKVAWTVPAGATGAHGHITLDDSVSVTTGDADVEATSTLTTALPGSTSTFNTFVDCITVVNSGTAGNVQLQWAQLASTATPTNVLANSFLVAQRIGG
jgi:hypothetical protein